MSQLLNKIKVGNSKRSTFDLSHHQVTTSDFGYLIPICYRDMIPNDDFVVKPAVFCRLAPLAVPTYGRISCRLHHFFVPYRILYNDWDSFITGSSNNSTVPPYATSTDLDHVLLGDPQYNTSGQEIRGIFCRVLSNLGLNPLNFRFDQSEQRISMFPLLAYYRIWLDYYMDSNLNDHELKIKHFNQYYATGGSFHSSALEDLLKVRNCCYKKDYFTTAKTNPQDGNPSMVGVDLASPDYNPGLTPSDQARSVYVGTNGTVFTSGSSSDATTKVGQFTVEALRAASSLQRYLERNNYVGSKIINRLLAHFGVAPTPERLDMAEYIGGDSFNIQIGDVTSTNSVSYEDYSVTQGLGLQAGKGVGASQSGSVRYHAKEHGVFMTLMSILPDTAYYQGISRFWTKGVFGDPLDYYTPEFENLGYQEILNKEVFMPSNNSYSNFDPDGVFGYTPRYSEYKFQNDVLAGDFVGNGPSADQGTASYADMDSWHLFRKFDFKNLSPLALNNHFVECDNHNSDYDRVFQFTDNDYDHFYFNIDVDVKATRDMVGFAEPSLDSTNNQGDGNQIELPYGGTRL